MLVLFYLNIFLGWKQGKWVPSLQKDGFVIIRAGYLTNDVSEPDEEYWEAGRGPVQWLICPGFASQRLTNSFPLGIWEDISREPFG